MSEFPTVNTFKMGSRLFRHKYHYSLLIQEVSKKSGSKCHFFSKKEVDIEDAHLLHGLVIYNECTRKSISLNTVGDSLFAHCAQLPSS